MEATRSSSAWLAMVVDRLLLNGCCWLAGWWRWRCGGGAGRRGAAGIFACALCLDSSSAHGYRASRAGRPNPVAVLASRRAAAVLSHHAHHRRLSGRRDTNRRRPALQRRIFRRRPRIAACNNPRRHPSYWLRWPVIAVAGSLASPPAQQRPSRSLLVLSPSFIPARPPHPSNERLGCALVRRLFSITRRSSRAHQPSRVQPHPVDRVALAIELSN